MDILVGKRSKMLVIIAVEGSDRHGKLVRIKCDCGVKKVVSYSNFTRMTSCGCWRKRPNKRHGHTTIDTMSPTYQSWRGMIQRCMNPNAQGFQYYGGRGIVVDPSWRGDNGFVQFLADMGERPEGRSLDRINVNGNYEASNCRWATPQEQANNRR